MVSPAQSRSVFETDGQEQDTSDLAKRVRQITVSAIKQMPILAKRVGGCVSLGQGIPSLNTPEFIRDAIIHQLKNNGAIGKYSIQPGVHELLEAIAADLQRTKGVKNVDPHKEIFVTCGGMEALATGITTIVERGDEVILPSPTYSSHIEQIMFAEGEPVFVPLIEEGGWRLDVEGIRKAVTAKTKAIVLCNPVNPVGAVFTESELRAVAEIVLKNDLFLVMDEAYDFLVYDGKPHFSPAALPELKDNILLACSFSKRYCMTGWRIGFMYAPERIVNQALKVHDAFAICAPTISQYAALSALRGTNGKDGPGDRSIKDLVAELAARREQICARLDRISDLFSYTKPDGGYFVFAKMLGDKSSIDFALELLNEAKVITIPGSAFGPTGEGHIRLSFGGTQQEIDEAFDRIEKFWKTKK